MIWIIKEDFLWYKQQIRFYSTPSHHPISLHPIVLWSSTNVWGCCGDISDPSLNFYILEFINFKIFKLQSWHIIIWNFKVHAIHNYKPLFVFQNSYLIGPTSFLAVCVFAFVGKLILVLKTNSWAPLQDFIFHSTIFSLVLYSAAWFELASCYIYFNILLIKILIIITFAISGVTLEIFLGIGILTRILTAEVSLGKQAFILKSNIIL